MLSAMWERARAGETVSFRPRGSSMKGLISDGALVVVSPCDGDRLERGDVVLVKVKGRVFVHLVVACGSDGRLQIGNNRGGVNGWVQRSAATGVVVSVDGVDRPGAAAKVLL